MATSELKLIITAQNEASGQINALKNDVQALTNQQKKNAGITSGLLRGTVALGAAYFAVKKGILDSVSAYNQQQQVQTKLQTVIMNHKGTSPARACLPGGSCVRGRAGDPGCARRVGPRRRRSCALTDVA